MKKDKEMLEIEQKLKVKKSLEDMEQFVAECEKKKADFVEKAKKAKQRGDNSGYRLACMGLASVLANKKKAEQMMLSMDIVMSMKDVSKMTEGFLSNMSGLCRDLSSVAKSSMFSKVGKEFAAAMSQVQLQTAGLDSFFDEASLSFEDNNMAFDDEMQSQIEGLINSDINEAEKSFDKSIEERLERLRKQKN